jgi:hypothetical protein
MVESWSVALPASLAATPGVDAAQAYLPLRSAALAAVSLTDGATVWSVPMADVFGSPETGDDLVFVARSAGVEALDAATGKTRWRTDVGGNASAPLLWQNGWLFVATEQGVLFALRSRTGEVIWKHAIGAPALVRPAAADDLVFLLPNNGRVLALALENGATAWEVVLPAAATTLHPLDDRVFVGCADTFFYCLKAKDGKQKWRWRTGGTVTGTMVVDDDHVYFLSLDNVLRALSRENGQQAWKASLPHRPIGALFLSGRLLLVPGIAVEVPAFQSFDGSAAGAAKLPGEPMVLPRFLPGPAGKDGRLLVATREKLALLVPGLPVLPGKAIPGVGLFGLPPEAKGSMGDEAAVPDTRQTSTGTWWPCSSSLMTRVRRFTPSTIFSFEGSENDSRIRLAPLPSTKNALPAT